MSTKWGDNTTNVLDPDCRERLRTLPESAVLVARALARHGPLAPAEVAEVTTVPDRAARYALNRLSDAGLVTVRDGGGVYALRDGCGGRPPGTAGRHSF